MTRKRTSENFRPLNTQIDPAALDGGNSGLGNARDLGELVLTQFLELANDADRLAH